MLEFHSYPQSGAKTARMEQRTTPEVKDLIERAACLQGVNASEFLITHGALAARETIRQIETTVLKPEDHEAFLHALDAVEPTRDLVDLMALYREVTTR